MQRQPTRRPGARRAGTRGATTPARPAALAAAVIALCPACTGFVDGPAEERSEPREKLVGADETWARPAIGRVQFWEEFEETEPGTFVISAFSNSTGTLVTPSVVLTAAHNVDYRTSEEPGYTGKFLVQSGPDEEAETFYIVEYVSFGSEPGRDDIALLRLDRDVPAEVAAPIPLSSTGPRIGEHLVQYGFGCDDRESHEGGGVKRRYGYIWWGFYALLPDGFSCRGDSGGPIIRVDAEPASIVFVHSASESADVDAGVIYAEVPVNHAALVAQIEAWSARGEEDPPEGEDDPPEGEEDPSETAPATVEGSLGACGAGAAVDVYGVEVEAGDTIGVRADTLSTATASDLCVYVLDPEGETRIGRFDDEAECSYSPPRYACPEGVVDQVATAGVVEIHVRLCSSSCADEGRSDYVLAVTVAGGPAELSLLQDQ